MKTTEISQASPVRIPAWVAILININIVIGSAFFLSAGRISSANGILAPFAWLLCGLMLLPLVIVLSRLSVHFPMAGGLYVYSRECLGSLWGFISGWGYYIGTAAANAVVIHAFSEHFQKLGMVNRLLQGMGLSGLHLDIFLVLLFTGINLLNVEFLERAQIAFAVLKAVPLILILLSVPLLFDVGNLVVTRLDVMGLFQTIPLVLFAYIGIEACCAISDKIGDGQKNAARVILVSFGLIMAIYTILQLALLCIHGTRNVDPFLSVIPMMTSNPTIIHWGNALIYCALLSSFLGGFYGMFYYNNWNLYAMGYQKSILFSNYLTKMNRNQVPWVCVLVQCFLVVCFLMFVQQDFYLLTMGDFGTTMAYLLSTLSYLMLNRSFVGFAALLSCVVFIFICTNNLLRPEGFLAFAFFLALIAVGVIVHKFGTKNDKRNSQ
jgi:amino acid transporter